MGVTARATGSPDGRDDLFNFSEVYQELVDGDAGMAGIGREAPPKAVPVRCVTKFKRQKASQEIQALQRVEVSADIVGIGRTSEGGPKDFGEEAMARIKDAGSSLKPVAIYKYRAILRPKGTAASQ